MSAKPEDGHSTGAEPLAKIVAEKAGALTPEDSVKTAGERMREHDAEVWPVIANRKLVGSVMEQDPDVKIGRHGHDPDSWRVDQIMSRQIVFCYEDEDCEVARQTMEKNGLSYLPVVDREMRIVGIFSRNEIEKKAKG